MFKKEKLIFALFLLTCLFLSMSFASANNITDMDEIVDDYPTKSFSDLNDKINDLNQTEIILDDDYIYQDECDKNFTEGIFINRSLTIDGKGHTIDANHSSRIFNINADNVILKNIKFKNGKLLDNGGAIYCNGSNIVIINSTFINNSAVFYGGAVYCNGSNIDIINSTFISNWASIKGSAVYYKYDGKIKDSKFINNYLHEKDAAYYYTYNGTFWSENVHNEHISNSINNRDVDDVVSFEKNYTVIISNSTFRTAPLKSYNYSFDPIGPIYPPKDKNNTSSNQKPTQKIIKKSSVKIIAKNKSYNKKTKIKKYSVILKNNKNKPIKNTLITLKLKNKIYKAKTNNKGKAIFKIKINKKGIYNITLKFKGNKNYKALTKKIKIKIK